MTVSGMSVFMVTASPCGRPRPAVPPNTNADLSVRGNQDGPPLNRRPRDEVAARRCASLGVAEGSKAVAETRKLAAILAAVGFSKLAGSDEERTLACLRGSSERSDRSTIAVNESRSVEA
jgi:hypothetical protein